MQAKLTPYKLNICYANGIHDHIKTISVSRHMLVVYGSMATTEEEVGVQRHAVAITTDSVMCTCLAWVTCMIKPFGTMAGDGCRVVASVRSSHACRTNEASSPNCIRLTFNFLAGLELSLWIFLSLIDFSLAYLLVCCFSQGRLAGHDDTHLKRSYYSNVGVACISCSYKLTEVLYVHIIILDDISSKIFFWGLHVNSFQCDGGSSSTSSYFGLSDRSYFIP
jgi:hypothetical protein